LVGIFSFIGYINYSLDKNESIESVDSTSSSQKVPPQAIYFY